MALLEPALRATLMATPAVFAKLGDRIYPQFAPAAAARPLLVYGRVGNRPETHAGGAGGFGMTTVQMAIWGDTWDQVREAWAILTGAMNGYKGTLGSGGAAVEVDAVFVSDDLDVYDEELERHGVEFDLRIWHRGE